MRPSGLSRGRRIPYVGAMPTRLFGRMSALCVVAALGGGLTGQEGSPSVALPSGLSGLLPKLQLIMREAIEVKDPNTSVLRRREVESIFDGSYDWHSCVFAHWSLLTQARLFGDVELETWLRGRLTIENLERECAHMRDVGVRSLFPYDQSLLLMLLSELAKREDIDGQRLLVLRLELEARIVGWLEDRETNPLRHPIDPPEQAADQEGAQAGTGGRRGGADRSGRRSARGSGQARGQRSNEQSGGQRSRRQGRGRRRNTKPFWGHYRSWLLSYWLVQLSDPVTPGIGERMDTLAREVIEPEREALVAFTDPGSSDFAWLPAIVALIDRTAPAGRKQESSYQAPAWPELPDEVPFRQVHSLGRNLSTLWPLALDAAHGDASAAELYNTRLADYMSKEKLWNGTFNGITHWIPQFIWIGVWLGLER